jgi:uncharacterized protein YutE (UPF0331/DUF86 family)
LPERDLLNAKVESIARCLRRIDKNSPATPQELETDYDAQDIVSVNLQRAIQLCVDLGAHLIAARGLPAPTTMADTFSVLADEGIVDRQVAEPLRRAVGFRNVSVHEYEKIDWHLVHRMITQRLDDFRRFVEAMAKAWDGPQSPQGTQ